MTAVSSFLEGLPSRGLLTTVQVGAIFTTRPVAFVADYDTSPPEGQVIKSDPTSLLIRNLQNRKAKEEAKKKPKPLLKRPAEDRGAPSRQAKRGGAAAAPPTTTITRVGVRNRDGEAGPSSTAHEAGPSNAAAAGTSAPVLIGETKYDRATLQSKTIKELQQILKSINLPVSGKKEDLISRLLNKK